MIFVLIDRILNQAMMGYRHVLCRQKNSGAEGERLKEAANINKSLSTLGYVELLEQFTLVDETPSQEEAVCDSGNGIPYF